ncbi:hypothetical protein M1P56_35090 (plasmid) [Streptomyces sp. HU2014]|uniref:hypothetical protein n=1 Tax=Streptomyces sp. HU2014 TaxID=2939414 RepID=UPI00200F9BA9|nr:hypothetical protein [Streptomyces sp. HU2014]UQI49742.1 hypothetical protein M1P56_35090 [Streptomyces sp. HU2014]
MRRRLVILMCALSLGTSLLTTGCGPYDFLCGTEGPIPDGLTEYDMAGTYQGKPFGTLTLHADGTFTAADWADFDFYSDKYQNLGASSGSWQLSIPQHHDRKGDPEVIRLHSPYESQGGGFFHVTGSRQQPRLYVYAGDPDSCNFHEFIKHN